MADQQIDELSLKIEVKENNTAKTLTAISSAIDKLTSSLKALSKFSTLIDQVAKIKLPSSTARAANAAQGSAPKYRGTQVLRSKSAEESAAVFKEHIAELMRKTKMHSASSATMEMFSGQSFKEKGALQNATDLKETTNAVREVSSLVRMAREDWEQVSEKTTIAADGTEHLTEVYQKLNGTLKTTITIVDGQEKSLKTTTVATKKAADETKKHASAWSKLIKSLGRIAFYRAIRSAIKEIAQTWREGLNNFVQYDEKTNKAMSDVMNSWTQIKNTIGVTAGYLMQTLAPLITTLADKVVDLLNNLNMALQKSKGEDKFAKAKKGADNYAKSLQKVNAQLLSFDTFTTLNGEEKKDDYDEGDVNAEWNNTAETFLSIINLIHTISSSLKQLWDEIEPYVKDIFDLVMVSVQEINEKLGESIRELTPVLIDAARELLPALLDLIKTIVDQSNEITIKLLPIVVKIITKIIKFITILLKGLTPIITAIVDIIEPILEVVLYVISEVIDLISGPLEEAMSLISGILEIWSGLFKVFVDVIKIFIALLKGDGKGAVEAFKNLINDAINDVFKKLSSGFGKVISWIANTFIRFVNTVIVDGLNHILGLKVVDKILQLFGVEKGTATIPHWNAHVDWKPFAEGGDFKTGDYFVANENGVTEMIASTNNGGSVMNIDQWASISYSSFFRALSDYGAARDDNGNVTISADTIGRALAGNRGFISEMNRRNGALNLR